MSETKKPLSVVELTADEYDRILKARIRELEAALEKYCHCRHACIDCFCTAEARAAMSKPAVAIARKAQ